MAQLVIWEVRDGTLKQGVLGLDGNCIIPEHAVSLNHQEEFLKGVLLPVLHEVIDVKFTHESSEWQCNDMLMICADPIDYTVVKETTNNHGKLIICNHFLMDKIIQTSMLELAHDGRGDVSCSKDWYFGRGPLFNSGHGSLIGRHCAKKSKRTRKERDYLGT
jgi:hypothetical protein